MHDAHGLFRIASCSSSGRKMLNCVPIAGWCRHHTMVVRVVWCFTSELFFCCGCPPDTYVLSITLENTGLKKNRLRLTSTQLTWNSLCTPMFVQKAPFASYEADGPGLYMFFLTKGTQYAGECSVLYCCVPYLKDTPSSDSVAVEVDCRRCKSRYSRR